MQKKKDAGKTAENPTLLQRRTIYESLFVRIKLCLAQGKQLAQTVTVPTLTPKAYANSITLLMKSSEAYRKKIKEFDADFKEKILDAKVGSRGYFMSSEHPRNSLKRDRSKCRSSLHPFNCVRSYIRTYGTPVVATECIWVSQLESFAIERSRSFISNVVISAFSPRE